MALTVSSFHTVLFVCFLVCLELLIFSTLCSVGNAQLKPEVEISWDFEENEKITPWGNGTAEQQEMSVKVESGELICIIEGINPALESPSLLLSVDPRQYLIFRAKYIGAAKNARILLRSGMKESPDYQTLPSKSYWTARQNMVALSDTGSTSDEHSRDMLIDEDLYSYYESELPSVVTLIFDLQDYRLITGLKMTSVGGENSPRRCILQQSLTTGIGPFETIITFVGTNTSDEQHITQFEGYARYWRLIVVDNHNGPHIGIREFYLDGYDERVNSVPFDLDNSGQYQIYYLPISTYLSGMLQKMRLEVMFANKEETQTKLNVAHAFREVLTIDYFRLARAPEIRRVTGCLNKFYKTANYFDPQYSIDEIEVKINGALPIHSFTKNTLSNETYPYATTYDCPLEGGVDITVEGFNFGNMAVVDIGSSRCLVKSNEYIDGRQQKIVCTLPQGQSGLQYVKVENGIHPGLQHSVPFLYYRVAPPVPGRPTVTNIAANKVDLVWSVPGNEFDRATVTGYKIIWFQPMFQSRVSNLTVGNITTTSVRGLEPATEYVFAIAAMSEGHESSNLPTDLYGRRSAIDNGMLSTFSIYTNITATLPYDFEFSFFNANKTLNSSGATPEMTLGPSGQFGSEGNYGLVMVGSANIQNCNVSSTCCDGYNATIGLSSCGDYPSVCAVLPSRMLAYDLVVGEITRRGIPTNLPYSNGAPAEINIVTLEELIANKGADLPSAACGPALRLTSSSARQSGAMWYRRKMDVREGFDTEITFEISNPSQKCDRLDDVNTYCRSRGADGIAFVIHNEEFDALGNAGQGIGYEGIKNALAVELDTFHNFEQMDFYENHVSVMTEGFRYNISANHSRSLGTTNRVPDLTDGIHKLRIKYDPTFDSNMAPHPSFTVNGHTTWFLNNADFRYGGEGDWGTGLGMLYVFLDDMFSPIITIPMNLGATLELDNGRAIIGMTAATGDEYWQAHDILSWKFSSLFIDETYNPPVTGNGEGAHACINDTVCVHRVDYDHYTRTNNWWGTGTDSTEGWQTGHEGYCGSC